MFEFAKLVPGEAHFYNLDGDEIEKQTTEIKWDAEAAEKGGFEHFMMKEIHEQPKAVQDTLNSVIKNGAIDLSSVEITEDEIKNFEQIYIVACGSAWHVGMAAQYVLEDIADIPVRVELASEFRYRKMPLNQKALVIVVSQSGETADTLAALRLAKEKGITTMAIVNVVGSSIAREADKVFYTLAGPEISVATTKAYSAQLAAMYCLAVQFAKVRGKIAEEQYSYYISELLTLPEKMQKALEDKERIQWFAAKYANAHDVFFVGRGVDYAVCLEGSLKLKEISYIHSEAYAAGELKHGTISLIEQDALLFCRQRDALGGLHHLRGNVIQHLEELGLQFILHIVHLGNAAFVDHVPRAAAKPKPVAHENGFPAVRHDHRHRIVIEYLYSLHRRTPPLPCRSFCEKEKGHKNQRDAVAAFPLMLMPDRTVTRTDKFTCLL